MLWALQFSGHLSFVRFWFLFFFLLTFESPEDGCQIWPHLRARSRPGPRVYPGLLLVSPLPGVLKKIPHDGVMSSVFLVPSSIGLQRPDHVTVICLHWLSLFFRDFSVFLKEWGSSRYGVKHGAHLQSSSTLLAPCFKREARISSSTGVSRLLKESR